jgi:hypothetical protein
VKADPLLYLGSLKSSNPLAGLPKNNGRLTYIHVQHSQLHSERERENNNNNSHRKKERKKEIKEISSAEHEPTKNKIHHTHPERVLFFSPPSFFSIGFVLLDPKERRASSRTSEQAPRNHATPWSNGLLFGSGIFSKNVLRTSSSQNSRSRRRIFLLQQLSHVVMLAYRRRLLHRRYLPNKTCCSNPSQTAPTKPIIKQFLGRNFIPAKSNHPRRMHVDIRYTQKNQKTHSLKNSLFSLSTQHQKIEEFLPTGGKAATLCWKISAVADEKL